MAGDSHDVEVAVVGGGPAGAALAIRLAAAGLEVAVFERLPRPRWRAGGVYSSPLTRRRLAALGLTEAELTRLIRPIPAMVVATADGRAGCQLDYPPPHPACGVDRVRLDGVLLARARAAGAEVHEGATVRQVRLGQRAGGLLVSQAGGPRWWKARLVVGADGPSSLVARSAGVARPTRQYRRAAITGHRLDRAAPAADQPASARLIIGPGWYVGLAPVPGDRINIGLVMGEGALRDQLASGDDLAGVVERALTAGAGLGRDLVGAPPTDRLEVQLPLVHRVSAAAGPGFLLVGDAAGFVDPISGEGLQRALASAVLAAAAIIGHSHGDAGAIGGYDQRLRARFGGKDLLSWLLQLFLIQPSLARRALAGLDRRPDLRRRFALALADLAPASQVIDPRFLARLLAP